MQTKQSKTALLLGAIVVVIALSLGLSYRAGQTLMTIPCGTAVVMVSLGGVILSSVAVVLTLDYARRRLWLGVAGPPRRPLWFQGLCFVVLGSLVGSMGVGGVVVHRLGPRMVVLVISRYLPGEGWGNEPDGFYDDSVPGQTWVIIMDGHGSYEIQDAAHNWAVIERGMYKDPGGEEITLTTEHCQTYKIKVWDREEKRSQYRVLGQ